MENCSNDFIINQNKIAFIPESKYADAEYLLPHAELKNQA